MLRYCDPIDFGYVGSGKTILKKLFAEIIGNVLIFLVEKP